MILCCGESLIDMLPGHDTAGRPAFVPVPGGAVFNTAVALGRLGVATGYMGGLSEDFFGDQLRGQLAEAGVDFSFDPPSPRPTTLAFVTLADGQAKYLFYDRDSAGRMFGAEGVPAIPQTARCLFFGGISLVQEPSGATLEAMLATGASDLPVMLDPNIRPQFIADEAAYRARLDRMLAMADIVKLSDEDLAWLSGEGDPETQARAVLDRGPAIVIVSRGKDGATAYTGDRKIPLPAPLVEVVDTVGAGDTFNAGFLAGLTRLDRLDKPGLGKLDDDTLRQALTLGAAVAAITVSRAGANPPWASELGGEFTS